MSRGAASPAPPGGGRRLPVVAALVALAVMAATYIAVMAVGPARRADLGVRRPQVVGDWKWGDVVDPRFEHVATVAIVAGCIAVPLIALARLRVWLALTVAAAIAAGFGLASGLSAALRTADPLGGEALRESQGAFPSGHAMAAAVLGYALIVAVPPRLRPVAVTVAAPAMGAMAVGLLALGWHYPSDVAGAFLLAFALAMGVLLVPTVRRERGRARWTTLVAGGAGATATSIGATIWGLRHLPDEPAMTFVRAHPGFMYSCGALTLLAIGTCLILTAALKDR